MAILRTESFLYWHMPKTGGMSVSRVLARGLGAERISGIRRHESIQKLDHSLREGRQVFGTHRDAWSWYASLYQHASSGAEGRERLRSWGNGEPGFKPFLYGVTHPNEVTDLERDFQVVNNFAKGDPDFRPSLLNRRAGLFTWTTEWAFGSPLQIDLLLDSSRLYKALEALLGVRVSPDIYPPQNAAQHRPGSCFSDPIGVFDPEMLEWVKKADRDGNALLGFDKPYGSARDLLLHVQKS